MSTNHLTKKNLLCWGHCRLGITRYKQCKYTKWFQRQVFFPFKTSSNDLRCCTYSAKTYTNRPAILALKSVYLTRKGGSFVPLITNPLCFECEFILIINCTCYFSNMYTMMLTNDPTHDRFIYLYSWVYVKRHFLVQRASWVYWGNM